MEEEVQSYLRRVSKTQRTHFSKGFAAVKPTTNRDNESSSNQKEFDALYLACYRTTNILPMKKKMKRLMDDDDAPDTKRAKISDGIPTATHRYGNIKNSLPGPNKLSLQSNSPSRSNIFAIETTQKRVSLIDKWFPGITLKEATVEISHAPSIEFVQDTVRRLTEARDEMILLRGGVEDFEALLRKLGRSQLTHSIQTVISKDSIPEHSPWTDAAITQLIKNLGLASIGKLLAQLDHESPRAFKGIKKHLKRLMYRRSAFAVPRSSNVKALQDFLHLEGPESSNLPRLSHFIWMDSANTTEFFKFLAQHFLCRVRKQTYATNSTSVDAVPKPSVLAGSVKASLEDDSEENDAQRGDLLSLEGVSIIERENTSAQSFEYPDTYIHVSGNLTQSQQQLLRFFQAFMPIWTAPKKISSPDSADRTTSKARLISSGYGVWLLACLVALDTPLDPDTDRLVHSWFRTCCDQIRVIGEWKRVHGERRSALLEVLETSETAPGRSKRYKNYTEIEDLGTEELRALYTIVVILAKFFRQNQNRLIPL